ncbi:MAG: STAS domain-containing protein [Melioribacteraceae bacterium]
MLNFVETEKTLTVKFLERMDTYKSQEMENELNAKIGTSSKQIVFDLEGVLYISSYFLRICFNTIKMIGKERFAFKNVRQDIKKVLDISGIDKLMNVG